MYAHAELDALLLRHLGIAFSHPSLNFDGTAQGIHHAGELDQHAVPGGLHDAASVRGDLGVNQCTPMGLELSERAFLVNPHEAAVAQPHRPPGWL